LHSFERTDDTPQEAVALKPDEYIKIVDRKTGDIRVEKGENLIFLVPFEEIMDAGVQKMVVVDDTHACLVRDIKSGLTTLITEPQMFVPSKIQEIVESQDLIVLKEFEVMVLVDPKGNFVFRHGWIPDEAAFFIPPYHSILKHKWSKTSFRKALAEGKVEAVVQEETFNRVDIRHRFMPYAFVVRTHDNVEIVLDIVLGWEIQSAEKMIAKTKNTTNDVCLKARSEIIEKVAQMPFRDFMQEVNSVVRNAVLKDDQTFYQERGIDVTSIQVEGFSCKNDQTEQVLQETVQETTNKMNRVLKQETANEVIKVEMEGRIREEELKKKVLEIQYEHEQIIARTDGEAKSSRVRSFLKSLGTELSLEQKLKIFTIIEKKESIRDLSVGTGNTLFCTPQDVNLDMSAFETTVSGLSKK